MAVSNQGIQKWPHKNILERSLYCQIEFDKNDGIEKITHNLKSSINARLRSYFGQNVNIHIAVPGIDISDSQFAADVVFDDNIPNICTIATDVIELKRTGEYPPFTLRLFPKQTNEAKRKNRDQAKSDILKTMQHNKYWEQHVN